MPYVVVTYYSDGTEQAQSCRDEESAQVDYLLQMDAMKSMPGVIERVQIATVIKDSDIPQSMKGF